jgi:DNA-binding response OmpR family regulator
MALVTLLLSRDEDVIRVFRRALDDLAVELEVCTRADAALDRMGSRRFDAVIVDCDDLALGVEVLGSVAKTSSNKRVIALSVINGITSMREAFELGAHFVLEKPLTVERAGRSMRAALGFMYAEQRRYFRFPVQCTVALKFPRGNPANCTSTNISEGGLAVQLDGIAVPRDHMDLRFRLPGMAEPVEAKGEFAWTDGRGNAGIRFLHLSTDSRRTLMRWLADQVSASDPNRERDAQKRPASAGAPS